MRKRAYSSSLHVRQESARCQSTVPSPRPSTTPPGQILRGFIADHLYKQQESYFSQTVAPVSVVQPLEFNRLANQSAYQVRAASSCHLLIQEAVRHAYKSTPGFLTPVELFKPWYSTAIARYFASV